MRLTRFKRISLALCAVIFCAVVAVAVLVPSNTADAYTNNGTPTTTASIYDNATEGFKAEALQTLIAKLQSAVGGSADSDGLPVATESGKSVASSNIIVEMGGMKWIAVYYSAADDSHAGSGASNGKGAANDGDKILTLWLAEGGTSTYQWNKTYDSGNNTSGAHPSNMYGTSFIRADVLNNGGTYYYPTTNGQNSETSGTASVSTNHTFANFTTDTIGLTQYLTTPRYMAWQYDQSAKNMKSSSNSTWGYDNNNDAWGHGSTYSGYDWSSKSGYQTWIDDYLWLPSFAETGATNWPTGSLWQPTTDQLKSSNVSWLRSGYSGSSYYAYLLNADGSYSNAYVSASYLVRPALHLNLTSAAGAAVSAEPIAKPTTTTGTTKYVYNGQNQYLDLGIASNLATGSDKKYEVSITTKSNSSDSTVALVDHNGQYAVRATQVGSVTVSVTPADGYCWEDGDNKNNKDSLEFTMDIGKRPVSLEVTIPTEASANVTYGTLYNTLDASKYWSYSSSTVKGDAYSDSATYEFLNGDDSLTAFTPAQQLNSGAFVTPGKYPLYLTFTGNVNNYDVTFHGNFSGSGSDSQYNNKAATVTVDKAEIDASSIDLKAKFGYNFEDGTNAIATHKLEVDTSSVKVAGNMESTVKVSYTSFWTSISGATQGTDYQLSNGVYTVWKVGTYRVVVTITAENHNDFKDTLEVTIEPTKLTVTLDGSLNKTFGDVTANDINDLVFDELNVSAGANFKGNADALKQTLTFAVSGQSGLDGKLFAGTYAISVTASEGFEIQGTTSFEGKLNVAKVDIELDVTYDGLNDVWDGSAKNITVTLNNEGVTYTLTYYKKTADGEYVDNEHSSAGVYRVVITFALTGDYGINYNVPEAQEQTMTIAKATPSVSPIYSDPGTIYTSGSLPNLSYTASVNGLTVYGTISWVTSLDSVAESGKTNFTWKWVADDAENIEEATGEIEFDIIVVEITELTVEFDAGDKKFYETNSIEDLVEYMTVTVTYSDENVRKLDRKDYTLTCNGGSKLVAGDSVVITVTFQRGGKTYSDSFTLKVGTELDQKKDEALAELEQWYEEKKDEIENDPTLTDEEKQEKLDDLNKKYEDAKKDIEGAKDLEDLEKKLEDAKDEMGRVADDLYDDRKSGNKDLDDWADEKKKEVDDNPDLTDDEKQKRKDDIDKARDKAKDDIGKATTPEEIEDAVSNGKASMDKAAAPDSTNNDPSPKDPEKGKTSIFEKLRNSNLPLAYAAIVLGAELLLIIILAIAARKPKKQ